MRLILSALLGAAFVAAGSMPAAADDANRVFGELDVFELEYAIDPQISPDGSRVAYVRETADIMTDRMRQNLWVVDADGGNHRPLASGTQDYASPRWSPDGERIAYVSSAGGRGAELYVRYLDTGTTALLSNLPESPSSLAWSPDGERIAFTMFVADEAPPLAPPPEKPEGAKWAPPVKVIEQLPYRTDSAGYIDPGHVQVFVIPADGGTPRQLTSGAYDHGGTPSWSPGGERLLISANRIDNPIEDPLESELWSIDVETGDMQVLTDRDGPDFAPRYSADGERIAWLGFDDKRLSYHQADAYVRDLSSGETRNLTADFDRSIEQLEWAGRSSRLLIAYDDRGKRRIARLDLDGDIDELVDDVGSADVGRPYTNGGFSVAGGGSIAYTKGSAVRPSDVGLVSRNGRTGVLTDLNSDLFAMRDPGPVEEITWQSSVGDYEIQGWIVKPPNFDPDRQYPLILEIHGGPFAAYGPHFSPELQLYASAGYVVLYSNPRGSTSYGFEFANEIHHDYPSQDYDDLMSGVDAMIETGYIDDEQLFVTGGSGGGVLTAWIVGKTGRFRAAVVQKPVINWTSFALTSDGTPFFARYWFANVPWEDPQEYWRRSPLSLVGNVTTPTMLLTGEEDFRTPMPESEQYYQALKLEGVDTALVRVPERSHTIVGRPSHLVAKAANILAWFERYRE